MRRIQLVFIWIIIIGTIYASISCNIGSDDQKQTENEQPVNDYTGTFTIPGTSSIHQVIVDIDTNETTIDLYALDYDISHSGTANVRDINFVDVSCNWDLSDNGNYDGDGVNLALSNLIDPGDSTKIIRLMITANPDTMVLKGTFTTTYTWQFMVTDPSTATHIYSLTKTATDTTGNPVVVP